MYRFSYTPFTYCSCSGVHFIVTRYFTKTSVVYRNEVFPNIALNFFLDSIYNFHVHKYGRYFVCEKPVHVTLDLFYQR